MNLVESRVELAPEPVGIAALKVKSIHPSGVHCAGCANGRLCLPSGLGPDAIHLLDDLIGPRRRVAAGGTLFDLGDRFHALFVIQSGSAKTTILGESGSEQLSGYHILGDLIGMDGIATDRHTTQATVLEDSEICELPFHTIDRLASRVPALRNNLYRVLSQEIVRSHGVMLVLGSMSAQERLVAFLLDLSRRYQLRGYSSTEFVLRLKRHEIGSYLGITLETVCRLFSQFQRDGLLQVAGRSVQLLDLAGLKQIVGQHTIR